MKKKRIFAMVGLGLLMSLGIASISLVATTGKSKLNDEENDISNIIPAGLSNINVSSQKQIITLKNHQNQKLAFTNLQNSAQNSSRIITEIILSLNTQLAKNSIKNDNNKNILNQVSKDLSNISERLYLKKKQFMQNINSKIKELDFEDADYKERLIEIQTQLYELNKTLQKLYSDFSLKLNPLDESKRLNRDFENLTFLKKAYVELEGNENVVPNFWNLINGFKNKNIQINSLFNLDKNGEEQTKLNSFVKVIIEIVALHIKRQLQTIAIALLIEENVSEEKLLKSFNKLSSLHARKIKQAAISNHFVSDVMSLESSLKSIESLILNTYDTYSKKSRQNFPKVFEAIQTLFYQFTIYKKWYFGFNNKDWNVNRIIRKGIKKIAKKLQIQLRSLTAKNILSIKEFNNLYQNSLFSSKQSEGFLLAWDQLSNSEFEKVKQAIDNLFEIIQKNKGSETFKTIDNILLEKKVINLKNVLDSLYNEIQNINKESIANAKNDKTKAAEYDNKIVSISDFTESNLLQAATDNLDFYTQFHNIIDPKILF